MLRRLPFFVLLCLAGFVPLLAQDGTRLATDYLRAKYQDHQLTAADVADLVITDDYVSGGVRHVYVEQRHRGLPVFNAQAALHFRGDRLVHSTVAFVPDIAALQLPSAPAFSAQNAVGEALRSVIAGFATAQAAGHAGEEYLFHAPSVSPEPIKARLVYLPGKGGSVSLAWRILIDQHARYSDYWLVLIDATTGALIDADNLVLKCNFGSRPHTHNFSNACAEVTPQLPVHEQMLATLAADGARYNVFAFGIESPLHGPRTMEVNPADSTASPFGWHDINGLPGHEFTITRGNNVYAYPDRDANENVPDPGIFADGGDSLVFDFFYADEQDPDTLLDAALTQVFYTTNKVHDWLYHAGFDEASGNFQRNNYKGDGEDRDPILAEAQDGSGTNNANFFTPPDGGSGVMQMFLWESGNASVMQVTTPASVAGPYQTGTAAFGRVIGSVPVTGQVVIVRDGSSMPTLGCQTLLNPESIAGKIALIDRMECFFEVKVANAQAAGAIGAIICNFENAVINMADSEEELNVTIPSVMISSSACAPLRAAVAAGDSVSVTFQSVAPPAIDGDFDSGIVAHEIGHGVSNRLVGGPSNTSCLRNEEQMGEGWSDFFTLASTPLALTPTPNGTEARGIGNYATRRGIAGAGIRRKPYSTDMTINNFTYDAIITSGVPHPLGEVWATTLWDMYWAMVDQYGFDEDLIKGTGGNNLAVELVVEGLKYTACNPGLLDGRDGILQADLIVNDGANQCLIWEVFARRGMGFTATRGDSDDRTDNREAFDISPYCIGGVQLTKTVDEATVNAGEGVTFTLRASSYREELTTNIRITDIIPPGMTVDPTSVRGVSEFSIDGNQITFVIGELEFEEDETILYSASTDPDLASEELFFDGAEESDDNWELADLVGNVLWERNDTTPYAGDLSWYVRNPSSQQDQVLRIFEPITVSGTKPGLRFFTQYDTEAGWDGGIVEVSTNGTTWEKVDSKFFRGGYRGEIDENGSAALLGVNSYWGQSDGYQEQIVDLGEYLGEDIFFRFRFVADTEVGGRGWWVDNIQLIDIVNYDSEATLTSDQGDDFTVSVGNLGVLIEATEETATNDPLLGETAVSVFPNPAAEYVNVRISAERAGAASVQLISVDGRVVHTEQLRLVSGGGQTTINTASLPAGIYLVQVTGASRVSTTKLTVH